MVKLLTMQELHIQLLLTIDAILNKLLNAINSRNIIRIL
jgi:hypothetical protein